MTSESTHLKQASATDHAYLAILLLWAIFSLRLFCYAWSYQVDIALGDEVSYFNVLMKDKRIPLAWIFKIHNEHFLVLPKLIYSAGFFLFDYSVRFGYFIGHSFSPVPHFS